MAKIEYNAKENPTLDRFHADDSFLRAIMGCVGSGKSVACTMEILKRAMEQEPNPEGVRSTRFAVIRNSYRELEDTTKNTFKDWIKPSMGSWSISNNMFTIDRGLPDGTRLHSEILFRALDTHADLGKLLSLELTGAWCNEARELPFAVIELLQTRVGRYPAMRDGGPTWFGIWIDTNPPDTDSRFYRVFEELRPKGYKMFRQPGGRSDKAENTQNLVDGYYERLAEGKEDDWVQVYVDGEYGFVVDGKPIYPQYKDQTHYMDIDYQPLKHEPIYIGLDFGLTPAAAFAQLTASGAWIVFDEIVTEDMGAEQFSEELKRKVNGKYNGYKVEIYGDPAGDDRAQTDKRSVFQVLRANGVDAHPAPDQDPVVRKEALSQPMRRLDIDGLPAFRITPGAPILRKGLRGGYCYKRLQVSGADRYTDKPDKNRYSHVVEALEYGLLGAGEGRKVVSNADFFNRVIDYSDSDRAVI